MLHHKIIILLLLPMFLLAVDWPLKVSQSGYYLEDQSGVPFFIAGDTPWSLMIGSSYAEATTYLDSMQSKGITAILFNIVETGYGPDPPNNDYGTAPFTSAGDFTTPNSAYFAVCDSIIAMAKTRGIVCFITPAYMGYGCGSEGWAAYYSSVAEMGTWGAWLGERYKDYDNIIWVGGGDADQSACGLTSEHRAMMDSILAHDTDGLTTAHSYRTRSAYDDYNEPWLNINSTYSSDSDIATESNTSYGQGLWPIFYIEGIYYTGSNDDTIIDQLYIPVLYGRHIGSFMGDDAIWQCTGTWTSSLSNASYDYVENYSALFRSRPWWKLAPDRTHDIVTANYSNSTAFTTDATCLMSYYTSATNNVTVDLSQFSGDSVIAYTFNTENANVSTIGTYASTGSQQFNISANNVLVLNNTDLTENPPGTGIYSEAAQTSLAQMRAGGSGKITGGGTGEIR